MTNKLAEETIPSTRFCNTLSRYTKYPWALLDRLQILTELPAAHYKPAIARYPNGCSG